MPKTYALKLGVIKYVQFYAENFCLSKPLVGYTMNSMQCLFICLEMARKIAELQFKKRFEKQQQKEQLRRAKQMKSKT